jgi:predicted DCC family thiol-disulfide oxidoreductase YuxK
MDDMHDDMDMEEHVPDRPLLVFDGDCSFCKALVDYGKQITGERVRYAPYQEVGPQFPRISREDFASAVKLILPGGEVRSGAHAVFSALERTPGKGWMLELYSRIPGVAPISETAYRAVARHRSLAYRVTKLLWGIPLEPAAARLSTWLFLRLLGAIYLIAFASFGVQAPGLIGSRGILPVAEFLPAVRQYLGASAYWSVPTSLWFSSSDGFIRANWMAGVCLSVVLMLGLNWRSVRVALFVLYLSLAAASQVFLSFQWDALLLEVGFLAIFLGSSRIVVWLFRWLLFRLMFLSGAVKLLSGDISWRSFTALPVHYETQPLPTPLAWYVYQWPAWFHHFSVGVVFATELLVPFLIFAPRRIRCWAALAISAFQLLIFLTGNYAFFNLLTIALCLFLLDDALLRRIVPRRTVAKILRARPPNLWLPLRNPVCRSLAALVVFVTAFQLSAMFLHFRWAPAETVIAAVAPFEIINTYGLFAVMTTSRPEIVIEGSSDGVTWLAYEFKYKPGELTRRPAWVEPYQPRLDWQMWFAALGDYQSDPWTVQLMAKLLEGSPDVLGLLGKNPFPGSPPHFVRALLYEYRFTTPAERRATGDWWHRELRRTYLSSLALHDR